MYQYIAAAEELTWTDLEIPGVSMKVLYKDERDGAMSVLTHMAPGASIPAHSHGRADETVYVLEGDFLENGQTYGAGATFYGRATTAHGPHGTHGGCTVLTHFSAEFDFVLV